MASAALAQGTAPVALVLDSSEADQALAILAKNKNHETITDSDWQTLFSTPPYVALKAREQSIGRPFTDQAFKEFLLSPAAQEQEPAWRNTLATMKASDMTALGKGVLAWLPPGASIHAKVFPEIKPIHNSFVWKSPSEGQAIFLYVEPQTNAKFENTVAHECHHIGLASVTDQDNSADAKLSPTVRTAIEWMTGFGEGEAMLAAAGSTELHPHWEDDALARARWDGDMMHFNTDLANLQQFFLDILDGKLSDEQAIRQRAAPFWGTVQGPMYTVGYEMAVLVEKRFGRERYLECLKDPRLLLELYNQVAAEADAKGTTLATWSPAFLARLR